VSPYLTTKHLRQNLMAKTLIARAPWLTPSGKFRLTREAGAPRAHPALHLS
jgi:hypothetical protein